MYGRNWQLNRLVASSGALVVWCLVSMASCATPTVQQPLTDRTAYTLDDGELRFGIWKAEYGLFDDFDIGTILIPWFLQVPNLDFKYEFRIDDSWSVATKLGFISVDIRDFQGDSDGEGESGDDDALPPISLSVIPLELVGSHRGDDLTITSAIIYTVIEADGADSNETVQGAAAVTNLQFTGTLEWRVSRVTTLLLHLRYLVYQATSANLETELQIDDYTSIEIVGAGDSDVLDVENAYSLVPAVHFAWDSFNLRLGLGYGNMNVPGVNFVVPTQSIVPEFDLYWRW